MTDTPAADAADLPLVTARQDGVLALRINRPAVSNKLDTSTMEKMTALLREATVDPTVKVITITGDDDYFCGGGQTNLAADVGELLAYGRAFTALHEAMRQSHAPIVAVVSGHCLAGGMSLLDSCDMAIAADNVLFGYPEIEAGFLPILAMATCRDKLPAKLAFEMFYQGRRLTAAEALGQHIVNKVVPRWKLGEEVAKLAAYLASCPPTALSLGRHAWHQMGAGNETSMLERMQLMLVVMLRASQEAAR